MNNKKKIKERDSEIERVNKLNEKRIEAGLLPETNWAYIEKRKEESKKEIEKYKKSSLSLEEIRMISEYQNRFRFGGQYENMTYIEFCKVREKEAAELLNK